MKIVVTRAPRLKLVNVYAHKESMKDKVGYWITADGNTVMVNDTGESSQMEVSKFHSLLWESSPAGLKYDLVYPMDSYEDLCRWVANGRKLEDLQGDCKSEWIPVKDLKVGEIATIENNNECAAYLWLTIQRSVDGEPSRGGKLTILSNGGQLTVTQFPEEAGYFVWPIRTDLGDTITIGG